MTTINLTDLIQNNIPKGEKGQKGELGDKGLKGEVGATGSTGSTGAKGEVGAGTKGDKGDTGSTGDKGDTGSTGSTGATGPAGSGLVGQITARTYANVFPITVTQAIGGTTLVTALNDDMNNGSNSANFVNTWHTTTGSSWTGSYSLYSYGVQYVTNSYGYIPNTNITAPAGSDGTYIGFSNGAVYYDSGFFSSNYYVLRSIVSKNLNSSTFGSNTLLRLNILAGANSDWTNTYPVRVYSVNSSAISLLGSLSLTAGAWTNTVIDNAFIPSSGNTNYFTLVQNFQGIGSNPYIQYQKWYLDEVLIQQGNVVYSNVVFSYSGGNVYISSNSSLTSENTYISYLAGNGLPMTVYSNATNYAVYVPTGAAVTNTTSPVPFQTFSATLVSNTGVAATNNAVVYLSSAGSKGDKGQKGEVGGTGSTGSTGAKGDAVQGSARYLYNQSADLYLGNFKANSVPFPTEGIYPGVQAQGNSFNGIDYTNQNALPVLPSGSDANSYISALITNDYWGHNWFKKYYLLYDATYNGYRHTEDELIIDHSPDANIVLQDVRDRFTTYGVWNSQPNGLSSSVAQSLFSQSGTFNSLNNHVTFTNW